jgi:hypothetical protein
MLHRPAADGGEHDTRPFHVLARPLAIEAIASSRFLSEESRVTHTVCAMRADSHNPGTL